MQITQDTLSQLSQGEMSICAQVTGKFGKGDFVGARHLLEVSIHDHPTAAIFRFLLGQACFYEGRIQEAKTVLSALVHENKLAKESMLFLAMVHLAEGDHETALVHLEAVERSESTKETRTLLAEVALRRKRLAEAYSLAESALSLDDKYGPAWLIKFQILMAEDKRQLATKLWAMLKGNPANTDLVRYLTRVFSTVDQQKA